MTNAQTEANLPGPLQAAPCGLLNPGPAKRNKVWPLQLQSGITAWWQQSILALQKGLAEATWYTSPVPKERMRELLDGGMVRRYVIPSSGLRC